MKKKNITLWALSLLCSLAVSSLNAQATANMPFNTGQQTFTLTPPVNTFFNFFDNGGQFGAYSNNSNANSVVTFAPSNPANRAIRTSFTSFQVETGWDCMYIFNSNLPDQNQVPGPGAATIGGFPGGNFQTSPGTVIANLGVAAVGNNPSRALTFRFQSDGSVALAGWSAVVDEVTAFNCAITAPPNLTVCTDANATSCDASALTNIPSQNPAGCINSNGLNLTYSVNGGASVNLGAAPPATVTINGIGVGAAVILWRLVDPASGNVISSASQTITVNDCTRPLITCPANITLNLDPGECRTQYSYSVVATDNCPFFLNAPPVQFPLVFGANGNGVVFTWAGSNAPGGFYFNLTNTSAASVRVQGFAIRFGPAQFGVVPSPQQYRVFAAPTFVGNTANAAAWTLIGSPLVVVAGPNSELSQVNINTPQVIAAGQTRGFYIFGNTSCPLFNYTFAVPAPVNNGPFTFTGGNFTSGLFVVPGGFVGCIGNVQVQYGVGGVVPVNQTSGLASGAEFPIGTTTNCFNTNDAAGNTNSCCFNVTVKEYPNAITSLICNDLINFTVDQNCSGVVNADQVLEGGPYGCYDNYVVQVDKTAPFGNGPWVPAVFGPGDIGKNYQIRVTDPTTGNKCWGNIKVEDKLPPVLTCPPYTLACNTNLTNPYAPSTVVTTLTTIFNSTNVPVNIPNNQTVQSVINIPANGNILDVNVQMDINHTWIGDLDITLESPSGTQMKVWDNFCVFTQNFKVKFDDEAALCSNPCVNYTNGQTLQPIFCLGLAPTNLSSFDNQNLNGQWKLIINDNDPTDAGVLNSWNLQITYKSAAQVPNTVPTAVDACSAVSLSFIDSEQQRDCASGLIKVINRKWTATDASGNSTTCVQVLSVARGTDSDIVFPPDYDGIDAPFFTCGNGGYPTPQWIAALGLQGSPLLYGVNDGCSINWSYVDTRINVCDGTYKIRRVWTIINWCTGISSEFVQLIKVVDNAGPVIACPANLTETTDPYTCCGSIDLPNVIVEDACSDIASISAMVVVLGNPATGNQGDTLAMYPVGGALTTFPGNNLWDRDTLAAFYTTPCLPQGTHTVVYTATDDCGNTSTCSFRLTVRDFTPPVVACVEFTTVAIGVDDPYDCYLPSTNGCEFAGVTWIKAKTFDKGSYDNCGNIRFTVQRMLPYSDCINALNPVNGRPECDPILDPFPDFPSEFERAITEYDSIKFYCCEVGNAPQTVILRVYQVDDNGNIVVGPDGTPVVNSCMVQVQVQDKLQPVCKSPANMTVSCENFDPSLWVYGKPQVYDNCCLDTTKVYQGQCGLTHTVNYSQFDTLCNRGTITRNFRVTDCHGQTSQCTQRIFVTYKQDYFVRFPDDRIVPVCDGTGNYGEPTFLNKDCELLGVSFTDEVFTVVPDACYKIERTWHIINWCFYNANLPLTVVPNPSPNATVNAPANNPGPVVSSSSNPNVVPAPWTATRVALSPGAVITDFSSFWSLTTNGYSYKQIIKVIDTQDPVIENCPPSPQTYCDLTPNNGQLWNQSYWWDGGTMSHDLCEGPADLNITATDACSGANINIRYLLFLDLDNNGSMETVVSSTNLPGFNNVQFNNAQNPNFAGGTASAFDQRPVPFNQKYGFALQTTVAGNKKSAAVRWNTAQSPTNYVIPELPYGTHKIKWIVEDGCGNEAVCEYTFIVKDCKAPTVVCLNGLAVNIMPTGMIAIWASDFLQYTEDNCTPVSKLSIAIRRVGQADGQGNTTGFPRNADGSPQTSVTFTCLDLGTQEVELWSIDLAGNADFCQTYIIIQDNLGSCAGGATVAGVLATEAAAGLEEANVEAAGNGVGIPAFSKSATTNDKGEYMFSKGLPFTSNSTVTPTNDQSPLNGVSTYDLVLISKHILGLEPLSTPYKMIAADANKSGSITTFDIVEIRKMILGIYTDLPNNTSWRFVDKSFSFPEPTNPFKTVFPENKTFASIAMSMLGEDFVSVKIGDVNGSAVANSLMASEDRTAGTLLFDVEDRAVKAGEEFAVTFKSAAASQGYQMTLGLSGLTVSEIVKGDKVGEQNFGVFADALTVSVDGAQEFTVRFRAAKSGKLSEMLSVSSRITKSEAYTAAGEREGVALRFNQNGVSTVSGIGFELYQNQPNPFVGKTFIGFHLPEAATATLTVFDESGRTVYIQKGDFAKGYNTLSVDRESVSAIGVLYYKVETSTDSATKKMIQTK